MKPVAGKPVKPRQEAATPKHCCGTLSHIAESRGSKKPEPARRQSPPGELVMIPRKYTAVV